MSDESIHEMYGPILIGVLLSMVLQGVLLSQMYSYYLRYKDTDTWLTKSLVLYLLVTETINCGFSIYMVYDPLVSKFGDPNVSRVFPVGLVAEPILMVAISTPIQIFVARRIVRLQKSLWIGGFIGFLSTISFAGGAISSYIIRHFNSFSRKPYLTIATFIWLIAAAVADVLIAASLAYSLWRKKTGLKTTDAVLSKIILLTVQTGFISSIAAVLNVIFLSAFPIQNASNYVFNITLMRLYGIFLLATLNARSVWSDSFQSARRNMSLLYEESPAGADVLPIRFHRDPAISNTPYSFVPNREYATIDVPKPARVALQNSTIERTRGSFDCEKPSYASSTTTLASMSLPHDSVAPSTVGTSIS